MGAADSWTTSIPEAVKTQILFVVAVPVQRWKKVFRFSGAISKPDAVVTDVGSTRMTVIEAARKDSKEKFCQYAPGHPYCRRGTARRCLRHEVIYSTTSGSFLRRPMKMDRRRLNLLKCMDQSGRKDQSDVAELHVLSSLPVSHLPHVLAYALVDMISKEKICEEKLTVWPGPDSVTSPESLPVLRRCGVIFALSNRTAISKRAEAL